MRSITVAVFVGLVMGACASSKPVIDQGDGGDYSVKLNAADFLRTIDNPWLPLTPGSQWVYEGHEGREVERIKIIVTNETRKVFGIRATVVRELEWLNDRLVEDTFDWFAQDRNGNVWYLGEDSKSFSKDGGVSTAGSWEAGVDGALPGIIMLSQPRIGKAYRQEYYPGEAEDMAEVVRRGASLRVPFGSFHDVLVTEEWTPLEPNVVENKYYKAGVGLLLEKEVQGGSGRTELIRYQPAQ